MLGTVLLLLLVHSLLVRLLLLLHAERLEVPAIEDFPGFCVKAPQGERFSKILEYISAENTKL